MRSSRELTKDEKKLIRDKVEALLSEILEQEGGIRKEDEGLQSISLAADTVAALNGLITKPQAVYYYAKNHLKKLLGGKKR